MHTKEPEQQRILATDLASGRLILPPPISNAQELLLISEEVIAGCKPLPQSPSGRLHRWARSAAIVPIGLWFVGLHTLASALFIWFVVTLIGALVLSAMYGHGMLPMPAPNSLWIGIWAVVVFLLVAFPTPSRFKPHFHLNDWIAATHARARMFDGLSDKYIDEVSRCLGQAEAEAGRRTSGLVWMLGIAWSATVYLYQKSLDAPGPVKEVSPDAITATAAIGFIALAVYAYLRSSAIVLSVATSTLQQFRVQREWAIKADLPSASHDKLSG